MNKQRIVTPTELLRLIELIESKDKEQTTPKGYIRLKDGTLVKL